LPGQRAWRPPATGRTARPEHAELVSKLPATQNTQQALIRINDAIGFLQKP